MPQAAQLMSLDIGAIVPNPLQPRQIFDEEELQDLADSIIANGLLQPIVVRPGALLSTGERGYYLIAGERRWRASELAGFAHIEATVRDVQPLQAGIMAAVENIQRADLRPLEEADHILTLIATAEQLGTPLTLGALEKQLGKGRGRGYIQNRLNLRGMGADVQAMVSQRADSLSHARLIDAIAKPEFRALLIQAVTDDEASLLVMQEFTRYVNEAKSQAKSEVLDELIEYYRQKREFLKKTVEPLSARVDRELSDIKATMQTTMAPDAQTQARSQTNARTGGGNMSRGRAVTSASAREANDELTDALERAQTTLQSALLWRGQVGKLSAKQNQRLQDLKALIGELEK